MREYVWLIARTGIRTKYADQDHADQDQTFSVWERKFSQIVQH